MQWVGTIDFGRCAGELINKISQACSQSLAAGAHMTSKEFS